MEPVNRCMVCFESMLKNGEGKRNAGFSIALLEQQIVTTDENKQVRAIGGQKGLEGNINMQAMGMEMGSQEQSFVAFEGGKSTHHGRFSSNSKVKHVCISAHTYRLFRDEKAKLLHLPQLLASMINFLGVLLVYGILLGLSASSVSAENSYIYLSDSNFTKGERDDCAIQSQPLPRLSTCLLTRHITLSFFNLPVSSSSSSPLFVFFYAPWCGHCAKVSEH